MTRQKVEIFTNRCPVALQTMINNWLNTDDVKIIDIKYAFAKCEGETYNNPSVRERAVLSTFSAMIHYEYEEN